METTPLLVIAVMATLEYILCDVNIDDCVGVTCSGNSV